MNKAALMAVGRRPVRVIWKKISGDAQCAKFVR